MVFVGVVKYNSARYAFSELKSAKYPIVLWLVCLFFAVRVFTPETYKTNLSSPQLAERLCQEQVRYKHCNLKRAYFALLDGPG